MTNDTTISQRAVSVFEQRPIHDAQVKHIERIKEAAAVLWEAIDVLQASSASGESARLVSLAKTELENSVMWAVKAVSRQ